MVVGCVGTCLNINPSHEVGQEPVPCWSRARTPVQTPVKDQLLLCRAAHRSKALSSSSKVERWSALPQGCSLDCTAAQSIGLDPCTSARTPLRWHREFPQQFCCVDWWLQHARMLCTMACAESTFRCHLLGRPHLLVLLSLLAHMGCHTKALSTGSKGHNSCGWSPSHRTN
jgi:hypothetical protein